MNDPLKDFLLRHEAAALGLGATGEPPLTNNPHDQGGMKAGLVVRDGQVILSFGKAVTWVGMTKQEALTMAQALIIKAGELP